MDIFNTEPVYTEVYYVIYDEDESDLEVTPELEVSITPEKKDTPKKKKKAVKPKKKPSTKPKKKKFMDQILPKDFVKDYFTS